MLGKILVRSMAAVTGVFLLLAIGAPGWRELRRHQLSAAMRITVPDGIDERRYVRIGGVAQWITIRGENRNNPAILLLHGGPGVTMSPLPKLFLPWEQAFTVVQWDQRGAGKSFQPGTTPPSIELMVRDVVEVSEYVRHRLHRDKIILLGHSWGSILGIHALRERPDLYEAWVGTGQIVNMQQNEIAAYNRVLAKARARGDQAGIAALTSSGAPPYHDIRQMGAERRWAMEYEPGLRYQFPVGPLDFFGQLLTAPDYSLGDVGSFVRGMAAGNEFFGATMQGPVMREDLSALGTDFRMPFFIVQGADDDITPPALARNYFDRVTAPRKMFLLLPDAGHMALLTRTDLFLQFLLANVRPGAR